MLGDGKRVMFTGGRAPVTLELARLFHQAGHTVFVAESFGAHLCRHSNAVHRNFRVPAPNDDLRGFGLALAVLIREHRIDALIPTCEEAFQVSRVKSMLPPECRVFVDDIQKMDMLHNKDVFIEAAREHGFPVPTTEVVTNCEEVQAFLVKHADIVLKPVYSRFASQVIILPRSLRDFEEIEIGTERPWVAQTYLGTNQFCTYSVAWEGELYAHSTYNTLYTAGQGASIYFESVQNQDIFDWVKNFVKAIGYTGQISFDFIENDAGVVMPIECNPRATSGAHLYTLDERLDQAFLGAPSEVILPNPATRSMVALAMLVYGLPMSFKKGGVGLWIRKMREARDAIFRWGDPLPLLTQFWTYAAFAAVSFNKQVPILAATTVDIEWNGEMDEMLEGVSDVSSSVDKDAGSASQ